MERSNQAHELLCRTRDSIRVIRGLNAQENITFASPCFVCTYSKSGALLSLVDLYGIKVLRTSDHSEQMSVRRSNVQLLHFSNCGQYLVSWEKPSEESPNLIIWNTTTGIAVYSLFQKKFMKELWPTIIFNADSTCFLMKNQADLCVYRIPEQRPWLVFNELRVNNFFASAVTSSLIFYSGDSREDSSKLSVYALEAGNLVKTCEIQAKVVQEVKVHWSKDGLKALIWCQTDVDTTGRSYYGEHFLYIYTAENKIKLIKTTEGPIHDIQWSPLANEFIVISGFMPATSQFFNFSGTKRDEIAKHPRNTIKWNPFGSLFIIAGFGNLQGEVDIYERKSLKLVGNCRASSTVYCEWGPCGKVFVAATLCPRMRVDNGYAIYRYTGELLYRIAESELWEVAWTPKVFEEEPLSPINTEKVVVVKKRIYQPPGSSSGFAAKFKAAKEQSSGKLEVAHIAPPPADYIPGMAPEPAKKKKKKKKPANK